MEIEKMHEEARLAEEAA